MKYFIVILFLPVFIYPQDSTSSQSLLRRTGELLISLNKLKHSVDSLKMRNEYLENVVFGETVLRWTGGDPDGDPVIYDVYFGDSPMPPLVATVQDTFFNPGRLEWGTTYYWMIVAKDAEYSVPGELWHFTTMEVPTQ